MAEQEQPKPGLTGGSNPLEGHGLKDIPVQTQPYPGKQSKMTPRPDSGEESYRGAEKLLGRKALITGADSGIGRAIAIAFAREGADVAINFLSSRDDAEETLRWVEQAGRKGTLIQADVSQPGLCQEIVRQAIDELGGLDILVNNAAYQHELDDILDLTPEQLEKTFRVNFFSQVYLSQAALRHMTAGGVILNTGSVNGLRGNPKLIDYAATKGAIHNFTQSLAHQLAEKGIRVNCVAPGPVWTPLIVSTMSEESIEGFGQQTVWKRAAQPAEIAPAYVFLASDDARFITGEILAITGEETTR